MKSLAVPLVIVGSLALLVAAVYLLHATASSDPPVAPTATAPARDVTQVERVAPPPATTESPAAPTHIPTTVRRPSDAPAPAGSTPEPAPNLAGSSNGPPGTRFNTKNLQYGIIQLREKIADNAPQIAACIGTTKPTGQATVTFIAAQKGDKVVIEQTDVDRDKTTLKDEALVECLHKAARSMQLAGLPREAEAIFVTRVITLTDGAITEDKPSDFSYMR